MGSVGLGVGGVGGGEIPELFLALSQRPLLASEGTCSRAPVLGGPAALPLWCSLWVHLPVGPRHPRACALGCSQVRTITAPFTGGMMLGCLDSGFCVQLPWNGCPCGIRSPGLARGLSGQGQATPAGLDSPAPVLNVQPTAGRGQEGQGPHFGLHSRGRAWKPRPSQSGEGGTRILCHGVTEGMEGLVGRWELVLNQGPFPHSGLLELPQLSRLRLRPPPGVRGLQRGCP